MQSPRQLEISSPRAPRSSHHRSSSTRTSPRQRDRRSGSHRPQQSSYAGSPTLPAAVPENLGDPDAFDVHPTSAALGVTNDTYQPPIEPAGKNRLMGGIVGGLRKAWQRNRAGPPPPPGEGIAYPQPAVVHEEETQYEPVPRTPELETMQYASPGPVADTPYTYTTAPISEGGHPALETPRVGHGHGTEQYAPVATDAEYPPSPEPERDSHSRHSHHRHESSSATSETAHATTQEHFDGTTMVNHGDLAMQIGSPEFVEPQPASDYAKMDSPPRSEASFGSYLSRVHRFFQHINDLPWIAPDRVTVDYVPGRARQIQGGGDGDLDVDGLQPTLRRNRPARKPIISWYNSNIPQGSIDLLSSGSPPMSYLGEFPQAKGMGMTPSMRYTDTVYANNMPLAAAASPVPPPPRAQPDLASQRTPTRPRRVPVPEFSPQPTAAGTMAEDVDDPLYSPRYPGGGYVPYDQLRGQVAQTYTGSSVNSALPPQQHV
ncbi:hypothetical protein R3P38DRAFT_2820413 [Favolaschia claudopus]|uniref:Uncharacterized protein n=1 Tax=Favolaschia claudopus TaxID=2862362 RepID=A0AAW0EG58_9AGAR